MVFTANESTCFFYNGHQMDLSMGTHGCLAQECLVMVEDFEDLQSEKCTSQPRTFG